MRKTWLALLAGVVVAGLPCCQERADCPATGELGHKIAGTWLGSGEVGDTETTRAAFITTYHAEGTAVATSARALGAGDPERHGLSTTHHIQWEATGPRSIRWRVMHFGHEVDGSLRYLSRTHGTVEFDETFQRGSVSFQVEVYEPEALLEPLDPNNPAAEPIFTTSGTSEIRRLHVEAQ
jgi:hypothetical protein